MVQTNPTQACIIAFHMIKQNLLNMFQSIFRKNQVQKCFVVKSVSRKVQSRLNFWLTSNLALFFSRSWDLVCVERIDHVNWVSICSWQLSRWRKSAADGSRWIPANASTALFWRQGTQTTTHASCRVRGTLPRALLSRSSSPRSTLTSRVSTEYGKILEATHQRSFENSPHNKTLFRSLFFVRKRRLCSS